MGMLFKAYLSDPKIWSCERCAAHLASHDDIISKQFQGQHGRAYLFRNVVNVTLGKREQRSLITGMHVVADIFCTVCESAVGWKYIEAEDPNQQYKVGKFILEKAKMQKDSAWT